MHLALFDENNHLMAVKTKFATDYGGKLMRLINIIKIITTTAIMTAAVGTAHAAKGGNKDKGNPDGGFIDAVFSAASSDPYIPYVESNSADTKGQMVFYGHMNMSQFTGTWDHPDDEDVIECSADGLREYDDDLTEGIIVIYPQESLDYENGAELKFWYRDVLESGKEIQHLLTMQGQFLGNWPPSEASSMTTVSLRSWKFSAENRKAQRQDCSGEFDLPDEVESLKVTITRE
jgi:hypothetical protein